MSTEDKITALEDAGKLVRVLPRFRGRESEVRRVSLLKDPVHDWTVGKGQGQDARAASRAHFGVFVKGEPVDDRIFMKRVSRRQPGGIDDFSDGVWSVRALAKPQYRFFGAFACPNWLIVLTMRQRLYFSLRPNAWEQEMNKALRIWAALFPGQRPWGGSRFSDYVSFNSEHEDERWEEN